MEKSESVARRGKATRNRLEKRTFFAGRIEVEGFGEMVHFQG